MLPTNYTYVPLYAAPELPCGEAAPAASKKRQTVSDSTSKLKKVDKLSCECLQQLCSSNLQSLMIWNAEHTNWNINCVCHFYKFTKYWIIIRIFSIVYSYIILIMFYHTAPELSCGETALTTPKKRRAVCNSPSNLSKGGTLPCECFDLWETLWFFTLDVYFALQIILFGTWIYTSLN